MNLPGLTLKQRKLNGEEYTKEIIKQLQPLYQTKIVKDGLIVSFRGEEYKVKYETIEKYGPKITADEIKRHFSFY